jgi:hypothetical protein
MPHVALIQHIVQPVGADQRWAGVWPVKRRSGHRLRSTEEVALAELDADVLEGVGLLG